MLSFSYELVGFSMVVLRSVYLVALWTKVAKFGALGGMLTDTLGSPLCHWDEVIKPHYVIIAVIPD